MGETNGQKGSPEGKTPTVRLRMTLILHCLQTHVKTSQVYTPHSHVRTRYIVVSFLD